MMLKSAAKVRPFCESAKKKVWKNADSQKDLTYLISKRMR